MQSRHYVPPQNGRKPTAAPGKPATGQSAADKKNSGGPAATGNSSPGKPATKMSGSALDDRYAKNHGQKAGVGL